MCLSRVDQTFSQPEDLITDAWKEFHGFPLLFINFGSVVKLDHWLKASDIKAPNGDITASDGKPYKPGFHAYADDPAQPVTRRVYLRKITCVGSQDGKNCVVAQEMYVPSNPDAWPPRGRKAR